MEQEALPPTAVIEAAAPMRGLRTTEAEIFWVESSLPTSVRKVILLLSALNRQATARACFLRRIEEAVIAALRQTGDYCQPLELTYAKV